MTRVKDRIQYSLKTTDQRLPNATMMWFTMRVANPLIPFLQKLHSYLHRVQFFSLITKFFPDSDKAGSIVGPRQSKSTPVGEKLSLIA